MFLVKNCKLIGELVEGTTLTEGNILVNGERIEAIAPIGTSFEGVTQELDAKGMTALPGMIEAHTHIRQVSDRQNESCFYTPSRQSFDSLQFAQFLLDYGYTTVRDCGDNANYSSLALRDAINRGAVKGPRVITCGQTLSAEGGGFPSEWDECVRFVCGPAEYRKAVREELAHGVDFIKLYGSGSMMAAGAEPGAATLLDDEVSEAVQTAAFRGVYCSMHCHGTKAIDHAVRLGVRTIEHASFIGEDTLNYLDGRTDQGIVPTLVVMYNVLKDIDPDSEYGRLVLPRVQGSIEKSRTALRNAYENHDVLIGWGTDIHLNPYRRDPFAEFRLRHDELGCKNIDILKQATINSAKLLCKDDQIGSLKVGKYADMLLVDGDPVADINVMYQKPAHVIKGGELIR